VVEHVHGIGVAAGYIVIRAGQLGNELDVVRISLQRLFNMKSGISPFVLSPFNHANAEGNVRIVRQAGLSQSQFGQGSLIVPASVIIKERARSDERRLNQVARVQLLLALSSPHRDGRPWDRRAASVNTCGREQCTKRGHKRWITIYRLIEKANRFSNLSAPPLEEEVVRFRQILARPEVKVVGGQIACWFLAHNRFLFGGELGLQLTGDLLRNLALDREDNQLARDRRSRPTCGYRSARR